MFVIVNRAVSRPAAVQRHNNEQTLITDTKAAEDGNTSEVHMLRSGGIFILTSQSEEASQAAEWIIIIDVGSERDGAEGQTHRVNLMHVKGAVCKNRTRQIYP